MKLNAMIEMLQELQRNVTRQYGAKFDPEVDVISHVNDAVAKGAREPSRETGHAAAASTPVELRVHFDFDDETRAGVETLQGAVLAHTMGAAADVWCHERTVDGWEIRDENRLLVAVVPDAQHEREDDARLIASAARIHGRHGERDESASA